MEQTLAINKKIRPKTREEWAKLDKEILIDHILSLEAKNVQLKNLLQKNLTGCSSSSTDIAEKKVARKRAFDFSKTNKRHVLLKFLYFGWDYQGFAAQEDSNNTIEHHLFEALTRTCLIESRATSNYQRCGRTDKCVSAFCQVISIDLRSKFEPAQQFATESLANELDYIKILNSMLPANIRCISWLPLHTSTYSARFDCLNRTYRYYFPCGSLDIESMRKSCKQLERHADFRNFCKMDVQNGVTNFMRHIESAKIERVDKNEQNGKSENKGYDMFFLEIKANAFLLHQIRCIMTILFLVGQGKEEPDIINELLDIQKNPCKPQYSPASGIPLNLFKCDFKPTPETALNDDSLEDSKNDDVKNLNSVMNSGTVASNWIYKEDNLVKLYKEMQAQWTLHSVRTTMIRNVLDELSLLFKSELKNEELQSQISILEGMKMPKQYKQLLSRKRCESLESRIDHFVKKQRLVVTPKEQLLN